ncbi:biopolymer transporter ExbD [Megasphaera paucivorans]|uniref:Biopolymer transport protein ExbD n=1 Tax=Megasphaera paucivorans TaxID=349095 RepID=A0A1G9S0M9_9FIRM|nr:biopolymer transporter ExbD [Megasphaera paucivorans]SDM29033.1 biopolymer transport protein ExbD [Megasphaera paucivorans]
MRLRDRRSFTKPEVMIIPMIDVMFFLLVFFMISTLYMVDVKTIAVHLPQAAHSDTQAKVNYLVTLKKDGTLWLDDRQIDTSELLKRAAEERRIHPQFAVVIRADQGLDYGQVIALLDELKGAGITHFGLAAEGSNEK